MTFQVRAFLSLLYHEVLPGAGTSMVQAVLGSQVVQIAGERSCRLFAPAVVAPGAASGLAWGKPRTIN